MKVNFYHLTRNHPLEALPRLVEKVYEAHQGALIFHDDAQFLEELNSALWTFTPKSFIPHGLDSDENAEYYPVLLSTSYSDSPRTTLICLAPYDPSSLKENVSCVIDMFDGTNPSQLTAARERWRHYKDGQAQPTYWFQNAQGKWEKKEA